VGNHLFVIFAVLDVSCAVNSCINHSFFTFIVVTVTVVVVVVVIRNADTYDETMKQTI